MKSPFLRRFVILVLTLVWMEPATCHPQGPPTSVCASMEPSHGAQKQTTSAPYTLTFSKNTYAPNDNITVTLNGNTQEDTFQGFFIQPRTDVNSLLATVGTFSDLPPFSRNPCSDSGNTTLSHSYANATSVLDRTSIEFTWTAPDSDVGPVIFVYTVVKVKTTFWVKLQSTPLTFDDGNQTQTTDGATQAPTQSTKLPDIVINWDLECGVRKGCFPTPADCSFNCDYLVRWRPVDNETVEFYLQRKGYGDKWIAIGFSDNRLMGNASVLECASVGSQVMVRASYNIPKVTSNNNELLGTPSYGISEAVTSHIDGILSCTFRRKISADEAVDRTKFFDLHTPWYLMVAMGNMQGTDKLKHSELKKVSVEKIDFLKVGSDTSVIPTAGPTGEIEKPTACGTSEGCFHDCDGTGKGCTFYIGWKESGDNIDMTIHCKQGTNRYCAVGLSNDLKMGDDSVTECLSQGSTVSVYVSYNVGEQNDRLSPEDYGLTNFKGSYQNGIMSCSFSRKKTAALATGRRKRATTAGASNYFDMNSDWYLFFATGYASGAYITQHDKTPVASAQMADFQLFQDLGAKAVGMETLVVVHAILMVIAWMLFASVGIVAPRFYKPAWTQDTKICGKAVWFQIHRACMVLAFLCCAASFIVIFIDVKGYAHIEGSNFMKAHPIMGIVVMALATINPIMSLFRCDPGTPKRPIFNVAHFLVGIGAYVIGIVNIFAGVQVADESVPDYVMIILYVFIGWVGLFSIVLHLYELGKGKEFRGESYELKHPEDSTTGLTEKTAHHDTFKIIALYIHIFVVIGLSVAVCVIIGLQSGGGEGGDDSREE